MTTSSHRPMPGASKRHVLAIDLGSGGLKAAVVSDRGTVVAAAVRPVKTEFFPGGGAEQDPQQWWQATLSAGEEAVSAAARAGVPREAIVAVACDSQWSVVVPVDEKAEPLMGAVHWLDSRGGVYNRRITGGYPAIKGYNLPRLYSWIRRSGLAPTHSGADSVGHLLFIKNERPEIYARAFKFLEPMDYLTARLTGRITATQKTMAPFMVCDNRRWDCTDYDDKLLGLSGVDREKFPELLPNNGIVGALDTTVAGRLGLSSATRVVAGVTDSFASLIGSGAIEEGEPIIYIGTSFYLTCHMERKKTDLLHMLTSLPSLFENRYYLFGEQGAGGRCVDHFLDNIVYDHDEFASRKRPADAYERFDRMAAKAPPGSDGLIFMPWLNGAVVPCESPHSRGGFVNITLETRRCHMARAIMEGLAFNSRWTMGPARKLAGRDFDHFLFSGGGALSSLWTQIHADILGVPVHQVADPVTATVRGTALLALVSLGHLAPADLPARVPVRRICEPDPSAAAIYNEIYPNYIALFNRTRGIFKRLNTRTMTVKEETDDHQQQ